MSNDDIKKVEQKIISMISELMGVTKSEIKRETSFFKDLNFDSLDIVELVMEIEDEFDISISDYEVEKDKFQTVGSIIDYIIKESS